MRRILICVFLISIFIIPVSAMEIQAPAAPNSATEYIMADPETFGEGLWYVIKTAIQKLQPNFAEASKVCLSLIAVTLLLSLLQNFADAPKRIVALVGAITIGVLIIKPSNTLIGLGVHTIEEINGYGKLLLPVMTTALAAQGGAATSAALYTGTALFNTILSTAVTKLLVPLIYIYMCLSVANSAIEENIIKKLRDFVKWLMTWCLKIILYVFTGYLGITGVISGTTDAIAMRAAKLTISGVVPVVGNIISDASEAILVSAGVMKNAAGIYGLLAFIGIWIGPFIRIGAQYILLRITTAVGGVFGSKEAVGLLNDFAEIMGFLLAMTGTICLLHLISTVCFMKGVG